MQSFVPIQIYPIYDGNPNVKTKYNTIVQTSTQVREKYSHNGYIDQSCIDG